MNNCRVCKRPRIPPGSRFWLIWAPSHHMAPEYPQEVDFEQFGVPATTWPQNGFRMSILVSLGPQPPHGPRIPPGGRFWAIGGPSHQLGDIGGGAGVFHEVRSWRKWWFRVVNEQLNCRVCNCRVCNWFSCSVDALRPLLFWIAFPQPPHGPRIPPGG